MLTSVRAGYLPANVSVITSTVSTACPTTVDPIVRVHSILPLVHSFIRAMV